MYTILIVDDDETLCRNIALAVRTSGYNILTARNGSEGIAQCAQADLILLDVMMPDMTGFAACEEIRKITDVPVLFLTSCSEEQEIVSGLDAGADDYITKPFRLAELLSRIKANLRRVQPRTELPEMELTAAEKALLRYLMQNTGHYVTREQILAACWDSKGNYVSDNTLSVHISRLRDKLCTAHFGQIMTKRGMGYQWVREDKA